MIIVEIRMIFTQFRMINKEIRMIPIFRILITNDLTQKAPK
jgi:hypothetical protein